MSSEDPSCPWGWGQCLLPGQGHQGSVPHAIKGEGHSQEKATVPVVGAGARACVGGPSWA